MITGQVILEHQFLLPRLQELPLNWELEYCLWTYTKYELCTRINNMHSNEQICKWKEVDLNSPHISLKKRMTSQKSLLLLVTDFIIE